MTPRRGHIRDTFDLKIITFILILDLDMSDYVFDHKRKAKADFSAQKIINNAYMPYCAINI